MITIERLNRCRSRFRAWMREGSYEYWLIYTDHMKDTTPRMEPMPPCFADSKLNFGVAVACLEQSPCGPPVMTRLNSLMRRVNNNIEGA